MSRSTGIFSAPHDQVGVVLMGTEETSNQLNDESGGYEHICEAFELKPPNWSILRTLENKITRSTKEANWFDALIVGTNYLRSGALGKKILNSNIILISPLHTRADADREQLERVTDTLREANCRFHVISNHVHHSATGDGAIFTSSGTFDDEQSKTEARRHNELQIERIVHDLEGTLADLNWAKERFAFFEPKSVRPTPWNSVLLIGTKIKLNISAYLQISEQKGVGPFKVDNIDGSSSKVQLKIEYFLNDKPIDTSTAELIVGYVYGSTVVPYDSTIDIEYKSGESRLDCLGFTAASNIFEEHLCGKGTYVVIAKKGCTASAHKLSALVTAMIEMQVIMIASKVYRKDTKPRLHALIPSYKKKHPCLVMLELIFQDEMSLLKFPPLSTGKHKPTPEQYDAVDHLIDSMNLMDGIDNDDGGSREAFAMQKTFNPTQQHVYRSVAHRATHPRDTSLPCMDEELKALINVPKKVAQRSFASLNEMKQLFELKEIQPKASNNWLQRMAKIKLGNEPSTSETIDSGLGMEEDDLLSGADRRTLVAVGTVTPAEDFALLLRRGEKFATVATQMQNVVHELLFASMRPPGDKVIAALMMYRGEAQKLGPYRYNEWMEDFKRTLLARHKEDFWNNVIVAERLGLINTSESDMSTVSVEQAEDFYRASVQTRKAADDTTDRDDIDADFLFDELNE
ncbi:X-ray repair cross-complementing protein 5 isoform X2 [Anopheles coustani]|uniref:X-ray repair cross-complementing protein 5 isoform X2 n=1 Tax=Anopheles coustani TaxID=139045 RepID=UPI00265AA6B9|nr:X-ray repair cross-complementing protein 5 isoform X2 [Anopheles coustani]